MGFFTGLIEGRLCLAVTGAECAGALFQFGDIRFHLLDEGLHLAVFRFQLGGQIERCIELRSC